MADDDQDAPGAGPHAGSATSRAPLTRARVLAAAVSLADEDGIATLSMRRLGQRLGVEAMSLYNHVAGKDDILDGMADLVAAEFDVPAAGEDWRPALRRSASSAHEVLLRHPWAGTLLESRSRPGPSRLRYLDAVVGALVGSGYSIQSAYYAFLVLDSYIYGFALQEASAPVPAEGAARAAQSFVADLPAGEYPHLVAMAQLMMRPDHDRSRDFEVGLALVLDALDGLDRQHPPAPRA